MRELSGIAKRRERSLLVLGARTFGDVAKLPSHLLQKQFGIWGQQLWHFAHGRWNEPLLLKVQDRTTISSATTLPYDEADHAAALTFALSEMTRLGGQLRREQLQARELALTIRFNDFTEVSGGHRFREPQFLNSTINAILEGLFRDNHDRTARARAPDSCGVVESPAARHAANLVWGRTAAERWAALDDATHELNAQFGQSVVMWRTTGPARVGRPAQNAQGQMSLRTATRNDQKNSGARTKTRWRSSVNGKRG